MTNPVMNPELFDKYRLAGTLSPGVVTFQGLVRKDKWDVKEAEGQDGASTTRKGRVPMQFKASHYLVYDPTENVDEYAEWDDFVALLKRSTSEEEAQALEFYHPDAAQLECGAVVVEEIGGLQHDGMGGATVVVGYLEYRPPKPKETSTPSGAKAGGTDPSRGNYDSTEVDPNQKAKDELAELLEEAKKP